MSETDKGIQRRQFRFPTVLWLIKPPMLRRYLFCLVCLTTVVAFFYAEEDWRGKHAWESYMRQSKERGIDFDWHAYIPPAVPDEQNFGMLPLFKPLFDYKYSPDGQMHWTDTNSSSKSQGAFSLYPSRENSSVRTSPTLGSWTEGRPVNMKEWQIYFRGTNFFADDSQSGLAEKFRLHNTTTTTNWSIAPAPQEPAADILLALGKFDSKLEELRQGSTRPYSRFPVHYNELPKALLAHLAVLVQACHVLQLRAIAERNLGKSQDALADVRLSYYCVDAVKTEPFMISQIVRARIITENLQPVWEGLRAHQWSEQNLEEIQQLLAGFDLLSDYERDLKSEAAIIAGWVDGVPNDPQSFDLFDSKDDSRKYILSWLPRGWYYQNELAVARFFQEEMLRDVMPETQQAFPSRSLTNSILFDGLPGTPYTFVFKEIGSVKSPQDMLQAQTGLNLGRIACSLERWRLAHGHFPETLAALVPDYLDKLPHDIINGKPLKYHLREDGQFILYSVGWNEKDDGGIYPKIGVLPANSTGYSFNKYRSETGDWVWQYPAAN